MIKPKPMKKGSPAFRAHMSKMMKDTWAKRKTTAEKNIASASNALRNFDELTSRANKAGRRVSISLAEPAARVVTFNYCPSCGEHLARLYPYETGRV
jgi:hypothetical protein